MVTGAHGGSSCIIRLLTEELWLSAKSGAGEEALELKERGEHGRVGGMNGPERDSIKKGIIGKIRSEQEKRKIRGCHGLSISLLLFLTL